MATNGNEQVAKDLRRSWQLNASREPALSLKADELKRALMNQGVPEHDIAYNKLYVELMLRGDHTTISWRGPRVRLPEWPDGLYADPDAAAFLYTGDPFDRVRYTNLRNRFDGDDAQRLLRDLVNDGHLDLALPELAGVVAETWALGEPYKSGVRSATWLSMFRHNGYASIGDSVDPPATSLTLYRGTTEAWQRGMSWTANIDVARSFAYDGVSNRSIGQVYISKVEPQWLLAYINEGHAEQEWVVDYTQLSRCAVRHYESIEDDPRPPRSWQL